ncbi:Ferroporti-1 [Mycena haematopus]|nr:Ferroporti-1 [Mycena haematopus]
MQSEQEHVQADEIPLLPENEGHLVDDLDAVGVRYLLIQHFSSAWGDRTAEFALYLYLIGYFKTTLLPSSIFGFCMTFTGIFFSHWAGSMVDKMPKLLLVRWSILSQKLSAMGAYICVAGLQSIHPPFLSLSNICISIAVERDWTACISGGSSLRLGKINTYLRQINLLCKLLAPLFVSFLTVACDGDHPSVSIVVLVGISVFAMAFELYWIQIVYNRFPILEAEQLRKNSERYTPQFQPITYTEAPSRGSNVFERAVNLKDWEEFVRLPVFLSSFSISLLYLTVLSFEGTMLGYLKTLDFRDDFLAEMRGLCVITGLMGTLVTVPLENMLGSARAGSWSIWSMVVCLLPVMASFYIFGPSNTVGTVLLFGGMALSRIGLWSFDLIQTKQLQDALATHARRNTLTALQFTMQNVADLLKYVLTMILSRPAQFRWAGLVSFLSVSSGAMVYLAYLKKERGHVFHSPLNLIRKML